MVAAEAAESRHALRAICLLAVLVSAKAITLVGRPIPLSAWSPFAYFWQDVFVALLFLAVDRALRRPALAWAAYALLAGYAAVNVPIDARAVNAADLDDDPGRARSACGWRPALRDRARICSRSPRLLFWRSRCPWCSGGRTVRLRAWAVAVAIALVAVGPYAVTRDRHARTAPECARRAGRHQPSARGASGGTADWRASPFPQPRGEDLSDLRGSMRGRNVVLVVLESTGSRGISRPMARHGSDAELDCARAALDRRSSARTRSIPRASRACSRRCARGIPPSTRRPRSTPTCRARPLPRILSQAGYRTGLLHSGRFEYLGMAAMIERRGFDLLEDAGAIGGQVNSSFGVDDASTVQRALQWIASLDGQRFFLTYLPIAGTPPVRVEQARAIPRPRRLHTLPERASRRGRGARRSARRAARARPRGRDARHRLWRSRRGIRRASRQLRAHAVHSGGERPRAVRHCRARRHRSRSVASTASSARSTLRRRSSTYWGCRPTGCIREHRCSVRSLAWRCSLPTTRSAGWDWPMAAGSICTSWTPAGRGSTTFVVDPRESRDRAAEFPSRVSAYRERVRAWAAAQKDEVR